MRFTSWWASSLLSAVAFAFQDASPFFASSSSSALDLGDFQNQELLAVSHHQLSKRLDKTLRNCPVDAYILVSQPNVSESDFANVKSVPYLRRHINGVNEKAVGWTVIKNLVGEMNVESLEALISSACHAVSTTVNIQNPDTAFSILQPQVIRVNFPSLPLSPIARSSKLAENDAVLDAVVSAIGTHTYALFYLTTPELPNYRLKEQTHSQGHEQALYEMDDAYPSDLHTDLKRDFDAHSTSTTNSTVGLFETYSFLSPGIFMTVFCGLILLSILYVGMTALSSLEVTYAAFSKEMGPAAQKKLQ